MLGYRRTSLKRVVLLTFPALLAMQILPSLAEERTPNPLPESVISPAPDPTVDASPLEEISGTNDTSTTQFIAKTNQIPISDLNREPQEDDELAPTDGPASSDAIQAEFAELPQPPKPRFADQQSLLFRAPGRYLIDPRATSALISPLQVSSDELVLLCLDAPGRQFQLSTTPLDLSVIGNGSSLLSLAGSGASITQLFNSAPGIRISSPRKIAPSQVFIGLGIITQSPKDQSLCSQMPINQRLNFMPLELTMTLVKNRISIR